MRSLIEFPGLNVSSLASTAPLMTPWVIRLMRTIGVLPIASRMVWQICFTIPVSSFFLGDWNAVDVALRAHARVGIDRRVGTGEHELARDETGARQRRGVLLRLDAVRRQSRNGLAGTERQSVSVRRGTSSRQVEEHSVRRPARD